MRAYFKELFFVVVVVVGRKWLEYLANYWMLTMYFLGMCVLKLKWIRLIVSCGAACIYAIRVF